MFFKMFSEKGGGTPRLLKSISRKNNDLTLQKRPNLDVFELSGSDWLRAQDSIVARMHKTMQCSRI